MYVRTGEFTLMNKKEFEYAMKRGLGRCVLELKENHDIEKFRDIVLKGCLNNYSYDTQCEGTRSEYMYVLQSYFDDEKFFEDKIIERFFGKITDSWLFDHLAHLLYLFADDGSKKSYEAMLRKYDDLYKRLRSNMGRDFMEQFEWLCVWLVTLEGFDRFKKIVLDLADYYERQAKRKACPVTVSFDCFWSSSKDYCDENEMMKFVMENDRKGIRIFWDSISDFVRVNEEERETQREKKQKPEVPTLEQLIEECTMKSDTILFLGKRARFSRFATEEQLMELAERIVHMEENKELKGELLMVFRNKPFPLDSGYLIGYAEDENIKLSQGALEALQIKKDERVKEYAYQLIRQKRKLDNALPMLFANYSKEDDTIILDLLKQQKISYRACEWHGVFLSALDWLEENADAPIDAAYYIYEHTLCSSCRSYLVKLMIDRGMMTEDIRRECKYDSNSDIREMV